MDDTDEGPLELVPPSPIAFSTQLPRSSSQHLPPLPQLILPGSPLRSRSELSPVARSSQEAGPSGLSLTPVATTTWQPGTSGPSLSPVATSTQQPGSSRTGWRALSSWVVRTPNQEQRNIIEQETGGNQEEVRVISDEDDDDADDDVIEIEAVDSDSDVISLDRDSDADSVLESSPQEGIQAEERQPADMDNENQNNTLVEQQDTGTREENPIQVPPPPDQEEQGHYNTPQLHLDQVPLHGTPGPALQVVQTITGLRESPADFRSPKRRRVISPVKSSLKKDEKAVEEDEAEDSECCPICFEPWTTSGNHRLCSLKCGHLFGQSCIDKWLKGQGGKCPHCNAKAKRHDIRVIYAKSIKALDTSEKDRALKDLEKEKEARRKAELEAAELRLKYQMAVNDSNTLRAELESLRQKMKLVGGGVSAGGSVSISSRNPSEVLSNSQPTGRFMADRVIKIWDAGNCRVMAYSPSLATVVVSQPSSSPLFPGFGVKKLSTLDFKTSQYMTVHSKAIRDIAFHPSVDNGMLLSCGLDKKVKMTNLLSNAVVQSYDTPMPAWSCIWNADDQNYFYTGLQNGLILEFDIRNTDGFVQEINTGGSRSPVAALKYMPRNLQAAFSAGGLLIGQLDRVQFFESLPSNHYKPHILPLDGSLTSLFIDPATRHILVSFRPTARNPNVRHQLCELVWHPLGEAACSCNVIYTFQGGRTQTVLSKTVLIQHPVDSNRLLVCAGDETDSTVRVWDSGSGQRTQSLPTGGITLDTCSLVVNQHVLLGALTEKKLNLFKWC